MPSSSKNGIHFLNSKDGETTKMCNLTIQIHQENDEDISKNKIRVVYSEKKNASCLLLSLIQQ